MHSKSETDDYTINRIWEWISPQTRSQAQGKSPTPDVVLPYGSLIENTKLSLPGIGEGFKMTALLFNGDLIVGPEMFAKGERDKEVKDQLAIEGGEFRKDIIYLKRAMIAKTIDIDNLPRK